MKNWNYALVLLFPLAAFVMCSSSGEQKAAVYAVPGTWTVTLHGKVNYPQSGKITINEITESNAASQDTITLKSDNTYSKTITLSEPGYYRLNFFNTQVLNIILYKSDVEVNVDGRDMNAFSEIKGSPELDFIYAANEIMSNVEQSPEFTSINNRFTAARNAGDQNKMMTIQAEYMELLKNKQKEVIELVNKQPASLGVINFLSGNTIDKDAYFATYISVADKLRKEWPDYTHARNFVEMVDRMKKTAIGQLAPEIALPNPEGQTVALSSLRGKYVLVDFWAKWCGPCRQENPNVVRAYNKYKEKGFTVYGVSLDRNKTDWLQAIQQDGLTWTHVSDLKYWQSAAAKTYDVTAIPFSLLLDPKGVIIGKNLRGAALDKKLEEIFSAEN